MPARIDWDLWEWIDEFFKERTGWGTPGAGFSPSYSATWPGGSVTTMSVRELRRDAEGEAIESVRISFRVIDGGSVGVGWSLTHTDYWLDVNAHDLQTSLEVQGRTREEAAGLAEVVGREVARADRGHPLSEVARRELVKAENRVRVIQQRSGRLRRLATEPNPWILIVGGAVLAGLILGLLTDWFGLG